MAKSALYTANTGAQAVAVGGTISLGSIIRRFGECVNLNGNGIVVRSNGYYDVDASITLAPTAAGTVTVTLMRDGVAVPGATASKTVATAGDSFNLSVIALVRQMGCCLTSGSALTLQLSGVVASVTNVAVKVVKL